MFDIQKIIGFFKKNFKLIDVVLIVLLVALYLATRIANIEKMPIFCDEGIYIHWAQVAKSDATWRFISLTDGRQPLQTWATIPFLKLFPTNALLAGRLFGVTAGFLSLIGVFFILFYLFGKKTAYIGSLFYIVTPYFLFYDRMAMADSAVNTGFIWILFFSIVMVDNIRLDLALLFGITSGLALLTKSTSKMFLALSVFSPVVAFFKSKKKIIMTTINYLILLGVVAALALVIYNIQRLSPFMHFITAKNDTFVMTIPEFLKNPFSVFGHNIQIIPEYVFGELGYVIGLVGITGLALLLKKRPGLGIYFFVIIMLTFGAIAFMAKVIFPRYLIFYGTILTLCAAYLIGELKNKAIKWFFMTAILAVSIYYGAIIIFNPPLLPFPEIDRGQYVTGACAGTGTRQIMGFAREKSQTKPVILVAEGNFGLISDMLNVFLLPGDKIQIKGYWPLDLPQLEENQQYIGQYDVYVVFSQRKTFPQNWPITFVKKYEKPGGESAYYLFRLEKTK